MKVIIFGATGMVGQGVLLECLRDASVESVLSIGRGRTGREHPKLREVVYSDFLDYSPIEGEMRGLDACFFCLGITSVGMTEAAYRRITYDFTLAAAGTLARLNPGMTFVYVSGAGTDSSERGSSMWARVKGATENALLRLPFRAAYMLRPGAIIPLDGIQSRTRLYRVGIAVVAPVLPWLYKRFPQYVTTTQQIGRAMIRVAGQGAPQPILESADINAV
ncbi:MAG: epimerase [Bryobacteraceae bacterium]